MGLTPGIPDRSKMLQKTTDAGAPVWAGSPIPTVQGSFMGGAPDTANSVTVASVNPNARQISVSQPSLYTPAVAAHEATHIFQNSRNGEFRRASQSLLPSGLTSMHDYDYGAVKGLQDHPLKSIGDYNPEQQATMVQDLTQAQANLKPHMSPSQLQQWDTTKQTLERPIRQLMSVPPPDTSLAGRADEWLAERGLNQHPFTRLEGQFSAPSMPKALQAPLEAPSVALGYPNKSKLVR